MEETTGKTWDNRGNRGQKDRRKDEERGKEDKRMTQKEGARDGTGLEKWVEERYMKDYTGEKR